MISLAILVFIDLGLYPESDQNRIQPGPFLQNWNKFIFCVLLQISHIASCYGINMKEFITKNCAQEVDIYFSVINQERGHYDMYMYCTAGIGAQMKEQISNIVYCILRREGKTEIVK